jgi:hypothetical protein
MSYITIEIINKKGVLTTEELDRRRDSTENNFASSRMVGIIIW